MPAVLGKIARQRGVPKGGLWSYPVVVDGNKISILIPERDLKASLQTVGRDYLIVQRAVSEANKQQRNLQAIFNGQVVPTLPPAWEWFRNDLAVLGEDYRANVFVPEPPLPPEPPQPRDPDLLVPLIAGAFPGGKNYSPIGPEDYFMPRFTRFEVPVGGFAGFAQQTPAGQRSSMPRRPVRRAAGRRRTRVAQMQSLGARRVGRSRYYVRGVRGARGGAFPTLRRRTRSVLVRRSPKKRSYLVKGSRAAKLHMAKLRRMVGKGQRRRRRR